jgi:hypothetical protein
MAGATAELVENNISQIQQDQSLESLADVLEQDVLISADAIPELHTARQRAATKAASILDRNHNLLANGQAEAVPLAIDALGTARRVAAVKRQYGGDSPQYREIEKGLVLDCERVIGEAERKLTWELFGDALQKRDDKTGSYFAHGISLDETVTAGLTPLADPEERYRRVNDYVEEKGTYTPMGQMIKNLGGLATDKTVSVYTFSECIDSAIKDYKFDPKGSHGGYVPAIEKFMTRDVTFTASGDRIERQLALSGVYITGEVIRTVLTELGVINESQNLNKTELHSKKFIDTASRGVLWLAELLDAEAGKQSSKRIFMGEEVDENHPMDYDNVPVEAEDRRIKS